MDAAVPFLFSVDLEDIRARIPGGEKRPARVAANTYRYLEFLKKFRVRCTFFVVGQLALHEPELIQEILRAGHEIACHSHSHIPLDQLGPDEFRHDLERNLGSLYKAGAVKVVGYRAPCFSLTSKTAWAYAAMAEFGLTYSSSVLPAANPIYGWPGFGETARNLGNIWEIPISLTNFPGLRVPHSGGVYFRILPTPLILYSFCKSMRKPGFVTSYFHPYDIDQDEERFPIPELKGNWFHNWLFYLNRGGVFGRLEKLMKLNVAISTYSDFVAAKLR